MSTAHVCGLSNALAFAAWEARNRYLTLARSSRQHPLRLASHLRHCTYYLDCCPLLGQGPRRPLGIRDTKDVVTASRSVFEKSNSPVNLEPWTSTAPLLAQAVPIRLRLARPAPGSLPHREATSSQKDCSPPLFLRTQQPWPTVSLLSRARDLGLRSQLLSSASVHCLGYFHRLQRREASLPKFHPASDRTLYSTMASARPQFPARTPLPTREDDLRPVERITDHLETPSLDDRTYRVIRLPNQLEALLVHDPETDKASAAMDVGVGSFSDEDDMPGMAHAVEHVGPQTTAP
jgi:hypothetical protein